MLSSSSGSQKMTVGRLSLLTGALLLPLIVAPVARSDDRAAAVRSTQPIELAQAPTPEEEKKKRAREQKGQEKGPPPTPKGQPQQAPKAEPQPPPKSAPTSPMPAPAQ